MEESVLIEASRMCEHRAINHVANYFGSGDAVGGRRRVVMDLLGSDVKQLLIRQNRDRFSKATAIRLGVQAAESLSELHDLGFLHRDVKPSNFVIGIGRMKRRLFVVDFGLARRFRNANGYVRQRTPPSFTGTVRYASLNIHRGFEASQRDDAESWLYSFMEWYAGPPSWTGMREMEQVLREKAKSFPRKIDKLPEPIGDMFDEICEMEVGEDADWDEFIHMLTKFAKESK